VKTHAFFWVLSHWKNREKWSETGKGFNKNQGKDQNVQGRAKYENGNNPDKT